MTIKISKILIWIFILKILALLCCTLLAVFFQKWWLILIGIVFATGKVNINVDEEE